MATGATSTIEKPCTRCGETKPLAMFRVNKLMKLGVDSWCKACLSNHRKQQRRRGAEFLALVKRCGGCGTVKAASEFPSDKGARDGLDRLCKTCRAEKHQRAVAANPERIAEQRRASARRRISTPHGRIHHRIRARVYEWLGTKKGGKRTFDLLGYTLAELRQHIERQFLPGMTWENAGKWHIDHIVPLTSFTISGPDDPEIRRAWALTNLRPLWATDNVRKSSRRTHLI